MFEGLWALDGITMSKCLLNQPCCLGLPGWVTRCFGRRYVRRMMIWFKSERYVRSGPHLPPLRPKFALTHIQHKCLLVSGSVGQFKALFHTTVLSSFHSHWNLLRLWLRSRQIAFTERRDCCRHCEETRGFERSPG